MRQPARDHPCLPASRSGQQMAQCIDRDRILDPLRRVACRRLPALRSRASSATCGCHSNRRGLAPALAPRRAKRTHIQPPSGQISRPSTNAASANRSPTRDGTHAAEMPLPTGPSNVANRVKYCEQILLTRAGCAHGKATNRAAQTPTLHPTDPSDNRPNHLGQDSMLGRKEPSAKNLPKHNRHNRL